MKNRPLAEPRDCSLYLIHLHYT